MGFVPGKIHESVFRRVDKRERETAANELLSTFLPVVANRNLVNLQRNASTSLNHVCSYYRQEMDFAFHLPIPQSYVDRILNFEN